MKVAKPLIIIGCCFSIPVQAMGLRSFVALPVNKNGSVVRLLAQHNQDTNTNTLAASAAYGISAKQTILLGLPYQLSSTEGSRTGDVSILYRHTVLQQDSFNGTDRLALLGGLIAPTGSDKDPAAQAGFVYTHFKKRHEVDMNLVYQAGTGSRLDSGRYDISWQYRLSPRKYPEWGLEHSWNSVLELNGRWQEDKRITHQVTTGLQWISRKWVIEGGIVKDINNAREVNYILSTRFHF